MIDLLEYCFGLIIFGIIGILTNFINRQGDINCHELRNNQHNGLEEKSPAKAIGKSNQLITFVSKAHFIYHTMY